MLVYFNHFVGVDAVLVTMRHPRTYDTLPKEVLQEETKKIPLSQISANQDLLEDIQLASISSMTTELGSDDFLDDRSGEMEEVYSE